MKKSLFISVLLYAFFSAAATGDHHDDLCVYTLYVKTGTIFKAGTDSNIGLSLGDPQGRFVWIPNILSWGLMEPSHDFFERGNLDVFSGRGPCIGSPICRLNLTSDGSGYHHGWYCDYVEVTSTGPHKECSQTLFHVDQWLATDAPPFKLTAELDGCSLFGASSKKGKFVVGNRSGLSASASSLFSLGL
ncbi:hypothetical protein JCGZ_26277 [Jatropha curcas]|uniref:PLAT domain-containing protein n=1 Tax=Jatropha curcas TaxID=180498 RepID=A0A067JEW4_JATCU|nr:PLAT domain-containing protein 3 [Jatropha curcas]KDP22446.1 hypothetical protein JCGZ_26277 [Jatropha curcas]